MILLLAFGLTTVYKTALAVAGILADVLRGRWRGSGRGGLAPEALVDLDHVVIDEKERV